MLFAFSRTPTDLAGLEGVRRDVDYLTIDGDVTVRDELTSSCTRLSDAEAIDDVVEAAFQELEEHFTRDTLRALSLFEEVAELTLEYAIGVLSLLLFLVAGCLFARLTTAVLPCCPGG